MLVLQPLCARIMNRFLHITVATCLPLLILMGCSDGVKSEYAKIILAYEGNDETFFDFADTSSYTCVPLETNEDCLIANYDKVLVNDSLICVVDQEKANTVYIFDRKGKFRSKISAQGRGPGEYAQLGSVVLHNGQIIVYDRMSRQMIFYNADGKCLKSIHSDRYRSMPFVALGDDQYASFMGGPHDYGDNAEVIVTDETGEHLYNRYIPRKKLTTEQGRFDNSNYFSQNNTGIYFIPTFEDVIYRLTDSGLESVFDFGFKKYMLSFRDITEDRGPLQLPEKYFSFRDFRITDNGTFVCCITKGTKVIVFLCGNIHSKKLITWSGDTYPSGLYKDEFVIALPPSYVANYFPDVENNDENNHVVLFFDFERYLQ